MSVYAYRFSPRHRLHWVIWPNRPGPGALVTACGRIVPPQCRRNLVSEWSWRELVVHVSCEVCKVEVAAEALRQDREEP